uniref:Uncharacterized protein n=1 Tax=Plectus sambesii TaxID=2011161 RepID=A0A914VNV5_9BILA
MEQIAQRVAPQQFVFLHYPLQLLSLLTGQTSRLLATHMERNLVQIGE